MNGGGQPGVRFVRGSVSVERHISKADELGLGAVIGPRERSIFGKMAASNP